MRKIALTQGYIAIVDNADYKFLARWKWHACVCPKNIYAMRSQHLPNGKCRHIMMHRVINKTPARFETDHVNGNGLDNRRKNLMTVTKSQNQAKRKPNANCRSKHKGVYWHVQHEKWCASIQINRKRFHLGLFSNERAAAKAFKTAISGRAA